MTGHDKATCKQCARDRVERDEKERERLRLLMLQEMFCSGEDYDDSQR